MFKLAQSPTFWAKVEAQFPAEKGGMLNVGFDGKFRRLTADELAALRDRITSDQMTDNDVAREILIGWRGVEDDDGAEAEFTPGNLDRLLQHGLGTAICLTFYASLPQAKRKN